MDPTEPEATYSFNRQAVLLLRYAPIAIYFLVWGVKTKIRHAMKVGALFVLSISTVLLLVEVLLETTGSERIHAFMSDPRLHTFHEVLLGFFVIAVIFLVRHHYHESKKPGYEYGFVRQLSLFMQRRQREPGPVDELIPSALELFYAVFKRAGVAHCSYYRMDGEALIMRGNSVYPFTDDPGYRLALKVGSGVAGLVARDGVTRYVPHVYFPFAKRRKWLPTLFFPHAVRLKFNHIEGSAELEHIGFDVDVYERPASGEVLYNSFVSVPVKPVVTDQAYGILNFDFARRDPLDKSDIAMAALFGLLLGDEIARSMAVVGEGGTGNGRGKTEHQASRASGSYPQSGPIG
ncbi:MAG TPA: hypothetical protein VF656_20500 [Pyrinomonadaceae bacterium]|jgi:hypothetical protein